MKTKIKLIETAEQRHFRLINAAMRGDDSLQVESEIAVNEDFECIKSWFKHYQIDQTRTIEVQLMDLCIAMGRELHSQKSLSGRPKVWTNEIKGILVVELEQMMLKNPHLNIEQAAKKLSKIKPWNIFIKSNKTSGDPSQVIKQHYYDSKEAECTQRVRDKYESLHKLGNGDLWEKTLVLLEKMSGRKYTLGLITPLFDDVQDKKI